MAKNVDLKDVVKHLVNGTLEENLCRICLRGLDSLSENIFATVCKDDKEYCIGDVLKEICNINISPRDKSKICSECFCAASIAYKFLLTMRRSEEILNFYTCLLEKRIQTLAAFTLDSLTSESLCIELPLHNPKTEIFDYDLSGISVENTTEINSFLDEYEDTKNNSIDNYDKNISESEDNSNIIIIANEEEESIYKALEDSFNPVHGKDFSQLNKILKRTRKDSYENNDKMEKRKRNPMKYLMCSKCPVRYKFFVKMKKHMREQHDIDLFMCTICKALIENKKEYVTHLKSHTNIHRCDKCTSVFKTKDAIIRHLKWHETTDNMPKTENSYMCDICGLILTNKELLEEHINNKHTTKYTCYFCGRMFKGQPGFESHIKKHEMQRNGCAKEVDKTKAEEKQDVKKYSCKFCKRDFMAERSLLWHMRLHSNERPYVCNICNRGYVSLNRRNQHMMCAHSAPRRRCPLCPAVFHLCSMVNNHIKKVHLKVKKRQNRITKNRNVFWRTETVPIPELSVSIQNEILELKAAQEDHLNEDYKMYAD